MGFDLGQAFGSGLESAAAGFGAAPGFLSGGFGSSGSFGQSLGDFIGDLTGTNRAADAAQAAAMAQAGQAQANRQQIMGMVGTAQGYAQATPQELNVLGQTYDSMSKNLAQQQDLMNSIHPALMEASKQALALLEGGTAASTSGVMQMRQQQRQQLISSLQSQYGPGAESTSIGQQALMQFDQGTQQMSMGMMNNLFGMASSGAPQGNLLSAVSGLQSVGGQYGNIQNRMLNTQFSGMNAIAGVNNQLLQTAGAPYAGDALRGQAQSALFNQLIGGGASIGAAYAGGYGQGLGKAAGTPAPTAAAAAVP